MFPKKEEYKLYTPVIQQYLRAREKTDDAILLFRFGDFYESFFDDALILSEKAEITLTGKKDSAYPGGKIPMAGIPHKTAKSYISKLLKAGVKLGICEQTTVIDPVDSKAKIDRKLVRIITPGTLIENEFLEPEKANYLVSVFSNQNQNRIWGIAAIDVSTSEVLILETSEENLLSELKRISPTELIVASTTQKDKFSQVDSESLVFPETVEAKELLKITSFSTFDQKLFEFNSALLRIKKYFGTYFAETSDCKEYKPSLQALSISLSYLERTYPDILVGLSRINVLRKDSSLKIDSYSLKNLEIFETYRTKNKKSSLFALLEKYIYTQTGKRKLRKWLTFPLISPEKIEERLEIVEFLSKNSFVNSEIKSKLRMVSDLERLATKVATKKINPREISQIRDSLEALKELSLYLEENKLHRFGFICPAIDPEIIILLLELKSNFLENLPASSTEGEIFSDSFNQEIKRLRDLKQNQKNWLEQYQETQRKVTQIKNLKISFNKIQGFFIEITKSNLSLVPKYYFFKQSLSNGNRYLTEELKNYERELFSAESKLKNLEQELFNSFRDKLATFSGKLRTLSEKASNLDCLSGFAQISIENNYTRPSINRSFELRIKDGRHPVVETELQANSFIPNDLEFGTLVDKSKNNQLMLLTGPNMSGKSTFMKQVALICIMSQIGCFVPASKAEIGYIDQIFTRIGASDDLSQGQSTFMVEMLETAYLLNNMSKRSLLILDEIGRGTSTYDGLAIAWSVAEYIAKQKARCIFATHYHELNNLAEYFDSVHNFQVTVEENREHDSLIFLHKVKPGGANKSYGIEVAKIAGLPKSVILKASSIMSKLNKSSLIRSSKKSVNSELQGKLKI